ncbi:baseplate J/gp47 family protein [Cohnella lupini]|uniref:Putative phage protein gp47/JayE n=1 Tax=Cohnella lupini TaxID=1294267 RepID=A0A3D9ISP8_9BACL|nr:baseplate J/gp47 family protein [Cohnella lupini]RED64677.1 putative phage protein gp47/JayE [Cohnella lupini]
MLRYENQTFETIIQRMLNNVQQDLDKREGSIIYDALAPAALELSELYAEMDRTMDLSFANTASGEYLDRRTEEFGVVRSLASKARRKGEFFNSSNLPTDVPVGSRFSIAKTNFIVLERQNIGEYILESEIAGIIGNQHFGSMLPIDYIENLASAVLSDVIIPGEDKESDGILRERFLEKVRRPGTSGNISDYIQWAQEIPGVGGVQVQPIWNGPGTVKVFVLNSEKRAPSTELVDEVQVYIAPIPSVGEGKAPIGARVTVAPAIEVPIHINVQVSLVSGAMLASVKTELEESLKDYFKQLAYNEPLLRTIRVSAIFLDNPNIVDFSALTLNGNGANIEMGMGQVAVLGTVSLHE